MFSGLTSRWRMPAAWAAARPVGHPDEQLDDLSPGPFLSERPLLERAAIDEFRYEVLTPFEFAGIEHSQDVRMVERRGQLRLALESAASACVGQIVGQEFDGDRPIELRVERAIKLAHPSSADPAFDPQRVVHRPRI